MKLSRCLSLCACPWILLGCGARTALLAPDDAGEASADVAMEPDVVIPPRCGDGVVDPDEACDEGPRNGDTAAFTLSQPTRAAVAVRPLAGRDSVEGFYAYRSASAHTGFELVGVANFVLHVDARDATLGLVFVAGRDDDLGGASQPTSEMTAQLAGFPAGVTLAVSDETDECASAGGGVFRGRWRFDGNTDGAAFRGLPWDAAWRVVVEPTYLTGVSSQRWVDGDRRVLALSSGAVVLEHRVSGAACRRDCSAPRCGDGRLDAGERCDDGNARGGDGCSADCQRFE